MSKNSLLHRAGGRHLLPPLGRNREFHKSIRNTIDNADSLREIEGARELLKQQMRAQKEWGRKRGKNKHLGKVLHVNDANKATAFRGIPSRMHTGMSRTQTIVDKRGPLCHRLSLPTPAELIGHCDVLGQYACADCCRVRQRIRCSEETLYSYPKMDVSETNLCGIKYCPHVNCCLSQSPMKLYDLKIRPRHDKRARHWTEPFDHVGVPSNSPLPPLYPLSSSELHKRVIANSQVPVLPYQEELRTVVPKEQQSEVKVRKLNILLPSIPQEDTAVFGDDCPPPSREDSAIDTLETATAMSAKKLRKESSRVRFDEAFITEEVGIR